METHFGIFLLKTIHIVHFAPLKGDRVSVERIVVPTGKMPQNFH
jgi:hypothetical protein